MRQRDRRLYDMLTRVRNFGATHAQLFPAGNTAHDAFAAVAAAIDQLDALAIAERSATQASRVDRRDTARAALADALTRAGLTARVLARTTPALEARCVPPLPKEDQALLTAARQFVTSAAPCAAQFAAHGIPIPDVEARIAGFEQALHQRGNGRDARVKATAEIAAVLTRAMDAVETLDVSVANCLAADPVARAVWRHDRRIQPRRRSPPSAESTIPTAGDPSPTMAGADSLVV